MTIENSLTASIALFNSEDTIQRAISSIQNQTWNGSMEILVVDDNSTDCSVEIVKKLQRNDERIRMISLDKNVGLGAVRNIQIEEAKGEYLAFLDSDDEWMSEKITKQFEVLFKAYGEQNTDNVLCSVNLLYYNPKTGENRNSTQPDVPYEMTDVLRWGANRPTPVIAACLGKKNTFKSAGPFDEHLRKAQDWDYSIRFFDRGGRFTFVKDEPLYKYYFSGFKRDPVLTEESINYLIRKHADLFKKYGLYDEVVADKLYYFISSLYSVNDMEFVALQKKFDAASICPSIYGKPFINTLNGIIDDRIKQAMYEMRIDRRIKKILKRILRF